MSEAKGIKEIMELLDGVKVLALAGKKITADGKVNLADFPILMEVLAKFGVLNAAYQGLGEAVLEGKDLSMDEAQAIVDKVMEIAKALKAA